MALRRARPVLSSAAAEVDSLLRGVEAAGTAGGVNIVAFSGGVDSSLVAALVHRVYPERSLACTGISAALPAAQLSLAREVATTIGIPMYEVQTEEGVNPDYIANDGMACFHCKSELYGTLEAVASFASDSTAPITEGAGAGIGGVGGVGGVGGGNGHQRWIGRELPLEVRRVLEACTHSVDESGQQGDSMAGAGVGVGDDGGDGGPSTPATRVVLYNGTNAEDRMDVTRVGLKAAQNYSVASPISDLTKDQVRSVARHLGLPNWNHAASPCLRSRLALGVLATDDALRRVEEAEGLVREALPWIDVHHNLR